MASVKVTKIAFNRTGSGAFQSSEVIKGEVTYEVQFTETEQRLDIAFIPTVFVKPSEESMKVMVASGINGTTWLIAYAKEVAFPQNAVRPSGRSSVALVVPISTTVGALLTNHLDLWTVNPGLNARVEVNLDIASTNLTMSNVRFSSTTTTRTNVVGNGTARAQ